MILLTLRMLMTIGDLNGVYRSKIVEKVSHHITKLWHKLIYLPGTIEEKKDAELIF